MSEGKPVIEFYPGDGVWVVEACYNKCPTCGRGGFMHGDKPVFKATFTSIIQTEIQMDPDGKHQVKYFARAFCSCGDFYGNDRAGAEREAARRNAHPNDWEDHEQVPRDMAAQPDPNRYEQPPNV